MEVSAEMAVEFLYLDNINLNLLNHLGTNGSPNIVIAHIDDILFVHRFRLHLKVSDHSSSAVFILKDSVASGFYEKHLTDEDGEIRMANIAKKSFLFKVVSPSTQNPVDDNTYVVTNICMDNDIVDQFQYKMNTEEYLCYKASFTKAFTSKLGTAERYACFDEITPSFKKRVFAPAQC